MDREEAHRSRMRTATEKKKMSTVRPYVGVVVGTTTQMSSGLGAMSVRGGFMGNV